MKKIISTMLLFLICLSLYACGDKLSLENKNDSSSRENILKEAEEIDFRAIGEAFEENKVNAEDEYYDKYYTTVGTVRQIERGEVTIDPLYAIYGQQSYATTSSCRVKLTEDEIKTLSTYDVIKVCGKMTYFKKYYDHCDLILKDAFCIDNTVEITAKVNEINNYSGGKKTIVLQEFVKNDNRWSCSLFYEIVVADSGAENSEEAEFMGDTYNIGDEVIFIGVLETGPHRLNNYFDVVDLKTISIIKKSG